MSELVDLAMALHPTRRKDTILVSNTGIAKEAIQLPADQVDLTDLETVIHGKDNLGRPVDLPCFVVTLPETLAIQKRLWG